MKALHATILLSIISNFSLHSMNIIRQKTHNSLTHRTIKHSVLKKNLISTKKAKPFLKNAKQFFDMSDINNIASAGNIVAAGVTGNPLYLLLIIPQILRRTSTYLHMQKSTELKTFEKDVKCLLDNRAIITYQLHNLVMIDYKIKSFTQNSDTQQLKRLNLLDEYNSRISKLEKEKSQAELTLIKEAGYLFDMNNTPKLLNQAKKHIDATKFIDYSCMGINFFCVLGLTAPMIITAHEGPYLDFLCTTLNGIISFKNIKSSLDQTEIYNYIREAIKVLKIKESKSNQSVNE